MEFTTLTPPSECPQQELELKEIDNKWSQELDKEILVRFGDRRFNLYFYKDGSTMISTHDMMCKVRLLQNHGKSKEVDHVYTVVFNKEYSR